MTREVQAWDATALTVHHDSPGDTIVERLGVVMEAFITAGEQLLIPADMDPTSSWAVMATTGEIVNLAAARAHLTRNWSVAGASVSYGGIAPDPAGALYRWEIWDQAGQLIDLVCTPVAGWSIQNLVDELRRAGWKSTAGAADPFTGHPEHRDVAGDVTDTIRVRPGQPVRWLLPHSSTTTRTWTPGRERIAGAGSGCRWLGRAGLRAVAEFVEAGGLEPGDGRRVRAGAALVGVVELHLSRPLFDVDLERVECCCQGLRNRSALSGHAAWCPVHELALVRGAAMSRLALVQEVHHV